MIFYMLRFSFLLAFLPIQIVFYLLFFYKKKIKRVKTRSLHVFEFLCIDLDALTYPYKLGVSKKTEKLIESRKPEK